MTAPELVDVVAGALAKHAVPAWGADGKTGTCFCSEPINAERPTIHARTRALSAHQARAVLAALTEAGNVEWGNMAEGADRPFENFGPGKQAELAAKSFARVYGIPVVSRLTLPWGRAE